MGLNSGRHEANPTGKPGRNRGHHHEPGTDPIRKDPRSRSRWWRWRRREEDELDDLMHEFAGYRRRLGRWLR